MQGINAYLESKYPSILSSSAKPTFQNNMEMSWIIENKKETAFFVSTKSVGAQMM